ncbi:MAG: hypothetical protein GF315_11255 [candidate division Zixibacteria bacterium]|nr:hypothetical protein [candidate division Zixibacteria bacterium]
MIKFLLRFCQTNKIVRKIGLSLLFCQFFLLIGAELASGTVFGVRLGFFNSGLLPSEYQNTIPDRFTGAYLGRYFTGGHLVYLGLSYDNIKFESRVPSAEISGRIYQPFVGLRYALGSSSNRNLRPYLCGEYFRSYTNLDSGNLFTAEERDNLEEAYSPWGFAIGFGTAYNSGNAVIFGAETGLKWFYTDVALVGENHSLTNYKNYRQIRHYILLYLDFVL